MKQGIVIYQSPDGSDGSGYGPNIIIQSPDGTTWLYGDLSPFTPFTIGQTIQQGQYLAQEGNPSGTGSTGYHVHIELEMLNYGESFKYGYNNSSDPCIPLGIPNTISGPYIYDGTPIPPEPPGPEPTPGRKRKKFPWAVFTKIIRKRRTI